MNPEIKNILEFNKIFVDDEGYKPYATDKYPSKKIAVVTCMDTRLVGLLPAALGIKNGDVKMIKNAGGTVDNDFDSTMRSILIAVYELGVNHIMVIGHTNCGVQGMSPEHMLHLMEKRGISAEVIRKLKQDGVNIEEWLTGFDDTQCSVADSVKRVRKHPLLPSDVEVTGYIIDSLTGQLTPLDE